MKKSLWVATLALSAILLVIGLACRKSKEMSAAAGTDTDSTGIDTTSQVLITIPRIETLPSCPNAPDYGDSIIYDKWVGILQDYKIKPKNTTVQGKYFAVPQGLVINSNTGEINVSKSEKGIRYLVGFVKKNTTDTCYAKLITAGITYIDHIYVMGDNDTLALPYYNANPNTPVPCDHSGDDDYPDNGHAGNNNCEYDDDGDLDGFGLFDQPPLAVGNLLNALLIRVRTKSGVINLKKSLADGAFGLLPINGMRINVTLYYRLNDASGKKLQKIPITFIYYNKKSDVPQAMRMEAEQNEQNFNEYQTVSVKPRPPMIILTRSPN